MSTEWDPIRADELPPGWSLSVATPDRLVIRWHDFDLALKAKRTDAEHTHPALGLTHCWELQLCYSIGECPCEELLTRAATRKQLEDELESYLQALRRRLSEASDPVAALRELRRGPDY